MDRRVYAAFVVAAFAALSAEPAAAQSAGDKLLGASRALSAANYSAAVTQLNAALASPDIDPAQTAHAMYQRGVAHRKLGQSSRAIADLSAALWLPALPPADKARAYVNRALAYRAVGMSQQADGDTASARKLAPNEIERMLADKGNESGKAASVTIASKTPPGPARPAAEQRTGEQEQAATPQARARPPQQPANRQPQPAGDVSVTSYMAQQNAAENSSGAPNSVAGDEEVAASAPAQEHSAEPEQAYPGVTVSMPTEPQTAVRSRPEEQAAADPAAEQQQATAATGQQASPEAQEEDQQIAEAEATQQQPEAPRSIAPPFFRKTIPDDQAAETPPPARAAAVRPAQRAQTPAWQTSVDGEATGAVPVAEPEQKSSNRVVRFFSSIIDRATGKDDEEKTAEQPEGARMAAANWSGQSQVVKAKAAAGAAAAGTYRLQLASSRSEDEARKLWQRISAENADLLNGQEPQIEKTDLGSLGTVWRLHIGPFNDKAESLKLCNAFKRSGVDCFLVTR